MVNVHELEHGSRSTTGTWTPFDWEDPVFGPQSKGEVVTIRTGGISGFPAAGLWLTDPGIAGCNDDGSCDVVYSAPLGDETMLLLEGSSEVTIKSSGKKNNYKPSKACPAFLALYHALLEEVLGNMGRHYSGTKLDDVIVSNINHNPQGWAPFIWEEPGKGQKAVGEFTLVRSTGSTGTLEVGLWRTGRGIPGCNEDGSASFEYSSLLGDETIMLLEGLVTIVEHESGKMRKFQAGDIIALPSGLKVSWTSEGPFVKTYFVATNDKPVQ
ncbi:hypothetical protein NW759_012712 [Fusarium solani]|nr:hypothetical protein NW759_012712 [Fusarium solani]